MTRYGALSAHQIQALLVHGTRDAARDLLDYLSQCTRLAAALEAFLPAEEGAPPWLQEGDALARRVAALVTRLTEERDQARAGMHSQETMQNPSD